VQLLRVPAYVFRSTATLGAMETTGRNPGALAGEAAHFGRLLDHEAVAWAQGFGRLNLAALAHQRGEDQVALAALGAAQRTFEGEQMGLFAAAARWRRGQLLGGEQGRQELAAAQAWMQGQTIQTPARFAAMWAPGFTRSG
jgi:hypothetical protein